MQIAVGVRQGLELDQAAGRDPFAAPLQPRLLGRPARIESGAQVTRGAHRLAFARRAAQGSQAGQIAVARRRFQVQPDVVMRGGRASDPITAVAERECQVRAADDRRRRIGFHGERPVGRCAAVALREQPARVPAGRDELIAPAPGAQTREPCLLDARQPTRRLGRLGQAGRHTAQRQVDRRHGQRLKTSEVLMPPKAKLLLITQSVCRRRPSPVM